ncbi:MAG: AgmX/PglI C-terminal domain-containing protein [Archangium sp.]
MKWVCALLLVSCASAPVKQTGDDVPADPIGGDVVDLSPKRIQQSDVMEAVLARKAELASCMQHKEPGSHGKVVMKWTIELDGHVIEVGPAPGYEAFEGTVLAACLATTIQSMPFPKTDVQIEPVLFPFKF